MSAWTCPDCGGGFPRPVKWKGENVCPWCYEEIAEHHTRPVDTSTGGKP